MNKSKVDCLFDPGSQSNLISAQLVEKLGSRDSRSSTSIPPGMGKERCGIESEQAMQI
jgi:hypothetical protein